MQFFFQRAVLDCGNNHSKMSNQCFSCAKPLSKRFPGLPCGACDKCYHANSVCSDVNKQHLSIIGTLPGGQWFCSGCRTSSPAHRNTRSRAGISGSLSRDDDGGDAEDGGDRSFTSFASMNTEFGLLRNEVREMKRSVDFCSDKITDFEDLLKTLKDLHKLTEDLRSENKHLKEQVSSLNSKLNSMEQHMKSNIIEIQDIPESKDENLFKVIDCIGSFIGHPLKKEKIDNIIRVPTRVLSKPKHIIVKFLSKLDKDEFMAKAKNKRLQMNNRCLSIDGISNKFFINEHLTTANKILHKRVRDAAKEHKYKFVWVQNGSILVRKDDRSKIIQISSEVDISKIN